MRDKYGVSWQIVPAELWEMMKDPDQQKTSQVMLSIFDMEKLDAEAIRAAYSAAPSLNSPNRPK